MLRATLYIIIVDTCPNTFVQTIKYVTPRVNPNINYELWVIMMCQCRFTDYYKCTDLVGDVDNKGGYT